MLTIGLDNRFRVMSYKRKITREDLPKGIDYPFTDDYEFTPEIVYWRKCWGLRDAVLDIISEHKYGFECYSYQTDTPELIFKIVNVIFGFMDEEIWKNKGDSIWTYDRIKPRLELDIINLILMIPFMKNNPDVYLEFYDSY